MRFNFIHVCKVLAFIGSVLAHAFFLEHLGHGNFVHVGPESGPSLIVIALPNRTTSVIASCNHIEKCAHPEPDKKSNSNNVVSRKADFLPALGANSISPSTKYPSKDLEVNYYFQRNELSHPPTMLISPNIRLPDDDDPNIIGSVRLRLFISAEGKIDDLTIEEVSIPETYVDSIVLGYKQISFSPGELNGKSVKSQLDYEINFTTDQTQATVLRRNR